MSIPGLPLIALGRNDHIAWGGTNMLGLSSSLFDVSKLDPRPSPDARRRSPCAGGSTPTRRSVNVSWDRSSPTRRCSRAPACGPRLSAGAAHMPSDEPTAFLKLAKAKSWQDFRNAFATYAVAGQNFLYADTKGNIGQLMAIEYQPAAGRAVQVIVADPANPDHNWNQPGVPSNELPAVFNPADGILVSCNNTRSRSTHRHHLRQLQRPCGPPEAAVAVEGPHQPGRPEALPTGRLLRLEPEGGDGAGRAVSIWKDQDPAIGRLHKALKEWDGHYLRNSHGAVAYQLLLSAVLDEPYRKSPGREDRQLPPVLTGGAYPGGRGPRAGQHLRGASAQGDTDSGETTEAEPDLG